MNNIAVCKQCKTVLESKHRHDFQMCNCDNQTFIDGGTDYRRAGGAKLELIEFFTTLKAAKEFIKTLT